jgi:DNA topoisomerase-1
VEAFEPQEYWTLDGSFVKRDAQGAPTKTAYSAELVQWQGEKPGLKNEAAVNAVIEKIKNDDFIVADVRQTEKTLKPKPPFTTSQMQQQSANRLGFTSRKTMQIAQQLYEGVNIGAGRVGLITYMRTDSVRIAKTALDEVREWIGQNYPAELPPAPVEYAVGKSAQDAHEAIRPTYTSYTPDYVASYLSRDQLRLYSIIWERFVSSQMTNAKTCTSSIDIANVGTDVTAAALFRLAATKVVEPGFYRVLKLLTSKEEKGSAVPPLKKDDKLAAAGWMPQEHWTQGPARFTDATIVKMLEEKSIGRPSTYAPIISVLLDRYYVTRNSRQLVPTILGRLINDMLVEYFPGIVNVDFTASMEKQLDGVEGNAVYWPDMIRAFYDPFKTRVDEVGKTLESCKGNLDEPTDELCEKCGKPMMKKLGRFGYFLACSGFPACRNARSVPLAKCPKCGGDVVARKSKGRGKEFYGCTKYPECDFLSHFKPVGENCPQCGWFLVEKNDKKNGTRTSCINPDCDYSKDEEPVSE